MTAYTTCKNCKFQKLPCLRRDELRVSLKGLGVTSVKFRCDDRTSIFAPGDRVSVSWSVCFPGMGDYGTDDWSLEKWPATVIQESFDGKFVIKVDDTESDNETPAREWIKNENLFCKVRRSKINPIDEPRRNLCKLCLEPLATFETCPTCAAMEGAA